MASIIGHEALHNVFTLIEPNFLQIKEFHAQLTPQNSLGIETYRTMFDLGFWKKLVYIGIESSTALQLCSKFYDRANFQLLSDFLDSSSNPEQLKQVREWQTRLTLKDYWLQTFKAIREIKEDKHLPKALTEASHAFKETMNERELKESDDSIQGLTKLY